VHSINAIRPYWWVRSLTGIAMDVGVSLLVYTLMKTSLAAAGMASSGTR
jgi:cytochrome c oxidase cbb3-type subunit 1